MTPPPWRLRSFETLPSTQDFCRARAEAGEPAGLVVRADRQTRGRGTQGRSWLSPPGNLALSILLRPDSPAAEAGWWSLLAGLALIEALAEALPQSCRPRLKWPNDVLLQGGKLAGILVESAARSDGRLDWVVIGVGANLASAPDVPDRRVACVASYAAPPPAEAFAGRLLARLDHWMAVARADGVAAIRVAWLGHGPSIGAPTALRQGTSSLSGGFAGLGDDGALLLDMGGRVRAFTTGEVEEAQPCCS